LKDFLKPTCPQPSLLFIAFVVTSKKINIKKGMIRSVYSNAVATSDECQHLCSKIHTGQKCQNTTFGKLKVPRSCYRLDGYSGVMPLDAQADMPDRCYSYLLQETMDYLSIRDSFDGSRATLENPKCSRIGKVRKGYSQKDG
jgi:hypothetical protein